MLCARYRKIISSRISEDHRLGIWFPRDTTRPRLIWAPSYSPEFGFHYPYFDPYLGPGNGLLHTIPFAVNKRRGLELDHWLTIWYCDYGEITNKSVLAAVEACHGMTVPCHMVGDYVVMSGQHALHTGTLDHEFVDVTLADFRHTLDWFSTYFDTTIREISSGGCVFAVKISSPREQMLYGRELFTSVAVDRDFSSNSDISPISQALGLPIRVCRLDPADFEPAIETGGDGTGEGERWTNLYARVLMTEIGLGSETWGTTRHEWDLDSSILLLQESREDMDLARAKEICCYCLEVLEPLLKRVLVGEISRQDVLREITFEKVRAWKPAEASDEGISELRPRRGFVAHMGSAIHGSARCTRQSEQL
ncbi:hypothetical protein BJX99DRAFT_258881 [Aspergillus californicus]